MDAASLRMLFRAFLRESKKFPNYNIREYVRRRAREGFDKKLDAESLEVAVEKAKKELEVVKRQGIVYGLYAGKYKNVMEL